jgi:hypothetical protein
MAITTPTTIDSYTGFVEHRSSIGGKISECFFAHCKDADVLEFATRLSAFVDDLAPVRTAFGWMIIIRDDRWMNRPVVTLAPNWMRVSCNLPLIDFAQFNGKWEIKASSHSIDYRDVYEAICLTFGFPVVEGHLAWRYPSDNARGIMAPRAPRYAAV